MSDVPVSAFVAPRPVVSREAIPVRGGLARALALAEGAFDRVFAPACNPWRHLGALAFLLFWVVAATGIYVYIGFDTRAEGAYASVERLSADALGACVRSLHRYASDALVLVVVVHLAREWMRGRYTHSRRFTWIVGVLALWLLFASGIGGFWLVWDALGQYSFAATLEWLDTLPGFDGALMRNLVAPQAVNDRLFSLLVFLHIGLPLALLAVMWVHVHRLARPGTLPPRALAFATVIALAALALVRPVSSAAPANPQAAPDTLPLDWYYLGVHAFADITSPGVLWMAVVGATLALLALPWLSRAARTPAPVAARVDPANCSGCGRCFADCPFGAVTMQWRPPGQPVAVVDATSCVSCGICVGACPTTTPFRGAAVLAPGIDLPRSPIHALRTRLEGALARLDRASPGVPGIVVFGCATEAGGPDLSRLADAHTATLALTCAGQLPPSFVDFALRAGADGVLITGCHEGGCAYRHGDRWTAQRLAGTRVPRLRPTSKPRVHVRWTGPRAPELARALTVFRAELACTRNDRATRSARPKRMTESRR